MKLVWNTRTTANAAYLGWLLGRQAVDADGVEAPVVQAVAEMNATTTAGDERRWWEELLAQASVAESAEEAVNAASRAIDGEAPSEAIVARRIAALERIERELLAIRPRLGEELVLRSRPIREAWETIGPGLTRAIGRATSPDLILPAATIALVQPLGGGGAIAHPSTASVTWEGMLAHPHPDLPETLRLAWALFQLGPISTAEFAGKSEKVRRLIALAAIPVTLALGEEFDLCRHDGPTIAKALEVWLGVRIERGATTEALLAWQRNFEANRPPWGTALVALEQSMPVEA